MIGPGSDKNLNQTSAFRPRLNFITSTKPQHKILTKLQFQNLAWTSTSKALTKTCVESLKKLPTKILPELQLQNLDQTLCWKSDQTSAFKSAPNCCQHVYSHPDLQVMHHHHPLFQITPVLDNNIGLSLSEPIQLFQKQSVDSSAGYMYTLCAR